MIELTENFKGGWMEHGQRMDEEAKKDGKK